MFWCSGDFDVGKQLCEENEKCVIYVDLVENGFLLAKVAGGPGWLMWSPHFLLHGGEKANILHHIAVGKKL